MLTRHTLGVLAVLTVAANAFMVLAVTGQYIPAFALFMITLFGFSFWALGKFSEQRE